MVLKKGAVVPIRVDDVGRLLPQHEGKTAGAHLLMGFANDAHAFRAIPVVSQDQIGRDHRAVVPYNRALKLWIFSSFFLLGDATGAALSKSGTTIPILVPSGEQPKAIRVVVTGAGR